MKNVTASRPIRTLFSTYVVIAAITLGTVHAQDASPSTPLPDSPGATAAQNAPTDSAPVATAPAQSQAPAQAQASPAQTTTPPARKPVGTAAAEKPSTTGIAASTAAGAAIAPGKQRRSRSLLIKVGAIIGAGVALGTVAALTIASPSRPPGSH